MREALVIFAKNPVPGKTKTRLAATVGNEMALAMYHRLCTWTRDQAMGLPDAERRLFYSEEIPDEDQWPTDQFDKFVQRGADLGARMEEALARTFADGVDRAIIIGTDCPGVTTDFLNGAFAALNDHDLVIGPALDGGYTLLGARRLETTLFRNMTWSTAEVGAETVTRARAAGLSVKQLAPLRDIDHEADWYAYGWPLPEL